MDCLTKNLNDRHNVVTQRCSMSSRERRETATWYANEVRILSDRNSRKNRTEIMKLKNTITELKNVIEGFHSRIVQAKGRIIEPSIIR